MNVSLQVKSRDRRMTPALYEWLRRENALRGNVQMSRNPARPGEMGDLADIIVVAVESGGLLSVVVTSVATWLSQRRNDVEIEIKSPDGRSVRVNSRGKANAEELLKALTDSAEKPQ